MKDPITYNDFEKLVEQIKQDLLQLHGVLLHGQALYRALGFETGGAFRQAKTKGHIPIPVFELENKRGNYALTEDVARWLASKRFARQK